MARKIFKSRINSLRSNLSLTTKQAFISFYSKDIRFLSGFNSSNVCCVLTNNDLVILTDRRYSGESAKYSDYAKIVICKNSIFKTLREKYQNNSFNEILIQTEKHSLKIYCQLIDAFGRRRIKLKDRLLDKFLSCHDEFGIGSIKNAVKIAETAFLEIIPFIKEGISEIELQAELRYRLNRNGSEEESFLPIVLFGKRTSSPHGKSGNSKLKRNSPILIDWGAVVNGYNSDLTRNIFFGKPLQRYLQIYELVRRASEFSVDEIQTGTNVKTLHKKVIQYFEKYNLGKYFLHGLGHGLSMELHSYPRISVKSDDELMMNQVITIEPGLYLSSKFGIRIEDDILIKENKSEALSALPRELIII